MEPRRVLAASLALEITANDLPASQTPGPIIQPGTEITWNYELSNTGDRSLSYVELFDNAGSPGDSHDDWRPVPVMAVNDLDAVPPVGTLLTEFEDIQVGKLHVDPWRAKLYATELSTNRVIIFNTQTLEVEKTLAVEGKPLGLGLSRDANTLFVTTWDEAENEGAIIGLNLNTQTQSSSFSIQQKPLDVATGADDRLYVLTPTQVRQLNPTTGQSVGDNLHVELNDGEMVVSPNRDRLYVASYGSGQGQLLQIDLTSDPINVVWSSPSGSLTGLNGQDLAISHDGRFVSYATGSGQSGYKIAKFNTDDMSTEGFFATGAFPREITYSPDGQAAYTVNETSSIKYWDANDFTEQGAFTFGGQARELAIDSLGQQIWAVFPDETRVYHTGRPPLRNIGDSNKNGLLDPQETWSFTATSDAGQGRAEGVITTSAIDRDGEPLVLGTNRFYFGSSVSLDLQSTLNGSVVDPNDTPVIPAGEQLDWRHTLTNSGTDSLSNVRLRQYSEAESNDDVPIQQHYVSGDVNENSQLDPGEAWQFRVLQNALSGQQEPVFVAMVDQANPEIHSASPIEHSIQSESGYFGLVSQIELSVLVDGQPAQVAPGPQLSVGDPVTLAYHLTNHGNRPLDQVSLVDDAGTLRLDDDVVPAYQSGDINANGLLDEGETWVYLTETVVHSGQRQRHVRASANDILDQMPTTPLDLFYEGVGAKVTLEMNVVNESTNDPPHPVAENELIQIQYFITNEGSLTLDIPNLFDDNGTPNELSDDRIPFRVSADTGADGVLSPGEQWEYRLNVTAAAGLQTHSGMVTANALDDDLQLRTDIDPVMDLANTPYFGVVASLEWTATASGQRPRNDQDELFLVNSSLTWNYELTNTGNVPLQEVQAEILLGEDEVATTQLTSRPHGLSSGISPRGTLLAEFPGLIIDKILFHPTRPIAFATSSVADEVIVFDLETMQIQSTLSVGNAPIALALSTDASRLYVACAGSQTIAALDTETLVIEPSIGVGQIPRDVVVGADGRLFVLGSRSIMQLDPDTGEAIGVPLPVEVSKGQLVLNPERTRLYYADGDVNPAGLYQIDVSGPQPIVLWESADDGSSGGNGQDLAISRDGSLIATATAISPLGENGAGQGSRRINLHRTTDMSLLGTFEFPGQAQMGQFPREITFSPDGRLAYAADQTGVVTVFSTLTTAGQHTIELSGHATELEVDPTGRYLLAALEDGFAIVSTGRASADMNRGDVNFNQQLDPGESWLYATSETVGAGQGGRTIVATALDLLSQTSSEQIETSFIGADLIGISENVLGTPIMTLPDLPNSVLLSDDRFELQGNQLKLKDTVSLSHALDDSIELSLQNASGDHALVRYLVVNVAELSDPWRNPILAEDVNNDGNVSALDALQIINRLNVTAIDDLGPRPFEAELYIDVSGDNRLSALDALLVINQLNSTDASGEQPLVDMATLMLSKEKANEDQIDQVMLLF